MDGGFYMVGDGVCPKPAKASRYIFAVKTDSAGKLLWSIQIGDTGYNYGKWGIQINDGNFVLVGSKSVEQKGSKYGYIEYRAMWVLSALNGTILSETLYPNNGISQELRDGFMCINPSTSTSNDEYIATGYIGGEAGNDDEPMFLIFGGNAFLMKFKYDSNTFKFTTVYEELFNSSIVGNKYHFMQGMRLFDDTQNQRYGISSATHNGDYNVQFGMISTDYSGKYLWSNMYPAANQYGSGTQSHPYSLITSSLNDGWVISGLALRETTGVPEGRMAKISSGGDLVWDTRFVYPVNSAEMSVECYGVSVTKDNGYITTCGTGWEGQISRDDNIGDKYTWMALLHRTDEDGNVDWQKAYTNQTGPNNAGEFVVTTKDYGYAMYIDSNTWGPPDTGGNFGLMVLNADD